MKAIIVVGTLALAPLAAPGSAQPAPPAPAGQRTPLLNELAGCRAITGDAERLACFDRTAARIDESERRGDLLVTDRAAVQRSKRSLFGLNLPSFDLFKRDRKDGAEEVREIESTLSGAAYANLKWTFVLADGARWRQSEVQSLLGPRKGDKVLIRRGALGSYFLKVNGSAPAVRVERIN